MKVGVNLWIWVSPFRTDRDLGLIAKVKSLGGEVVEFAMEDDGVIDAKTLKETLENEEMGCSAVALHGPDRDLSQQDASTRQRGMEYARRSIDTCAEAGVSVYSGAMAGVGGEAVLSNKERRTRLAYAAECLRELAEYAARAGIRLGFEVLNRYENNLINTAQEARELIDLVNHSALGIHLDTFHMGIEEKKLDDAIRLAGDKLFHLHGSASHRGVPGEGHVDWEGVATALKQIDYQGYVVIESFDDKGRLAPLARFWHPQFDSPEGVAQRGTAFLKSVLGD